MKAIRFLCLMFAGFAIAPAWADLNPEDDDPNERIAFRLSENLQDGLTGVVVARFARAEPGARYEFTARILRGDVVLGETQGQVVSALRPYVVVQQPGGGRLIAQFDVRHRIVRASYALRDLGFDREYTAEFAIRELTAGGPVLRLSGSASAMLTELNPDGTPANVAPVARIVMTHSGADHLVGTPITVDGSTSSDANGDSLAYSWSVALRPPGSNASFVDPHAAGTTFVPDVAGTYAVQLVVNDDKVESAPAQDSAIASFPTLSINVVGANHSGFVSMNGLRNCHAGELCSVAVRIGDPFTLTAMPGPGYELVAWGGACSAGFNSSTVNLQISRPSVNCMATFAPAP